MDSKAIFMNKLKTILLILFSINTLFYSQRLVNDSGVKYLGEHTYFKKPIKINIQDSITHNANEIFNIPIEHKLVKIKEEKSIIPKYKHIFYQQYFNNIPIIGSRIIFHFRNDSLFMITGKLNKNISINHSDILTTSQAINNLNNSLNVIKYKFQDTTYENMIKRETNDTTSTYYPKTFLCILKKSDTLYDDINNYILVYPIRISAIYSMDIDSSYKDTIYYVSAHNGRIIKRLSPLLSCFNRYIQNNNNIMNKIQEIPYFNLLHSQNVLSCASDCNGKNVGLYYYGSQDIYTEKFLYGGWNCTYRLKDNCTGTYLYVKKYDALLSGVYDFRSDDNSFSGGGNPPDQAGATALWCIRKAHDFYRNYFNRNSYDNNYAQVLIKIGRMGNFGNGTLLKTGWDLNTNEMTVGLSPNTNSYETTLDIIGHEFTHGVTHNISGFWGYDNEEGALGEGISDIFGQAIEHYVKKNYSISCGIDDYFQGSCIPNISCGRSLSNPKSTNNPDTYYGINWVTNSTMGCNKNFAHTNSTIISHWYYLLSEGGQGINDLGNYYCVHGIGQDKAIKIVYESLNYISVKDFINFSYDTQIASLNLFGLGIETAEVMAAWYAVGVGGLPNLPYITIASKIDYDTVNYNYNNSVIVLDYTAAPGSYVDISSSQDVNLKAYFYQNPTPPNLNYEVHFSPGSEAHVYIAPGCIGGARLSNNASDYFSNIQTTTIDIQLNNNEIKNNTVVHSIFPNPASTSITIQLSDNSNTIQHISIKDITGRSIIDANIKDAKTNHLSSATINISTLPEGLYFVEIQSDRGIFTEKMVVKRN